MFFETIRCLKLWLQYSDFDFEVVFDLNKINPLKMFNFKRFKISNVELKKKELEISVEMDIFIEFQFTDKSSVVCITYVFMLSSLSSENDTHKGEPEYFELT